MHNLAETVERLFDLRLTPAHEDAFARYATELAAWNERVNLTAITDPAQVEMRHFADSLSLMQVIPRRVGLRVIDIGTGAGFPGMPLKIICPEIDLTLVESVGKKVRFLEHLVAMLDLTGVTVINARAEEVGREADHREAYDWAVARAVAGLNTLAEYLLPLVRVEGHALAQKGETASQEATAAEDAIKLLGGEIRQLTPVELPGVAETHYLVQIAKVAPTPEKYPRRPGMPSKRPLGS